MAIRRYLAGAAAVLVGLTMPAPAAAQFDLSGFRGPVTITHYNGCADYFCASAAIGVGKNSSGRYFGQLLHLEESFDAEGFDATVAPVHERSAGHEISALELDYDWRTPPTDPINSLWWFLSPYYGEQYTTEDYGTPPTPGRFTIWYWRHMVDTRTGEELASAEKALALDPTRVTTTPEPATLVLLGSGLLGLLASVRYRRT